MTKFVVFFSMLLMVTEAFALTPNSKEQYCNMVQSPQKIVNLTHEPKNLMAFYNYGGLFNGGVCWWHSLYQRSALYLTVYRPELPIPDEKRLDAIVHLVAAGKRVVEIPGYSNFFSFSLANEARIQKKLEQWQLVDGFLKQEWIRGLWGYSSLPPEKLAKRVTRIHAEFARTGDILWTMLQLRGIASHAWLILDVAKIHSSTEFKILDSNLPLNPYTVSYLPGRTQISGGIPYLGRNSDLKDFKTAADDYCSGVSPKTLGKEEYFAEIDQLDNDLE